MLCYVLEASYFEFVQDDGPFGDEELKSFTTMYKFTQSRNHFNHL